jgi:IS605 OrfB family transposase
MQGAEIVRPRCDVDGMTSVGGGSSHEKREVKVVQAYRFALEPTPSQERALRSHDGAFRFAWNWGLAKCVERYDAERRWYSAADLHKLWNAGKKADPSLAWWPVNSKCAYQEAFRDLKTERVVPEEHVWPGSAIGIDLGIKSLLTGADGAGNVIMIEGPKALRSSLRRLRRASRAHSRKAEDSANRRKHVERLAELHARVANVRADALHKATTALAACYETVVAEDLNVAGLTRNRCLARAISDQGFGQARRMLGYKTYRNGGRLILADRFYPSSKTCSGCGAVKAKLPLHVRMYECERCGLVLDRDVNAARNLLGLAASGAERVNASGSAGKTRPAGHSAKARTAGRTRNPAPRARVRPGPSAGNRRLRARSSFMLTDPQRQLPAQTKGHF